MTLQNHPWGDGCVDPLTPTIFHEPWWLEIATGGRYRIAEVRDHGVVVGRLPYYVKKKMGGVLVGDLPPLTHFLGPALVGCEGKSHKQFTYRQDVTRELISQLPKTSSFYLKCHRDVSDVIAFQGAGFRAGVQFTQEVLPQSLDDIWVNMRSKARQAIRGAHARGRLTTGSDPDLFMRFYAASFEKNKGMGSTMDRDIHAKLIRACLERGRGKIYEARERDGTLAAAIFCAWDNVSSYYLMTSRSNASHHGSTIMLVWEAIKEAVERKLIFDFDGIVSEGGARAANNFTPLLSPRYTVLRESAPMRIYRSVQALVNPASFFY